MRRGMQRRGLRLGVTVRCTKHQAVVRCSHQSTPRGSVWFRFLARARPALVPTWNSSPDQPRPSTTCTTSRASISCGAHVRALSALSTQQGATDMKLRIHRQCRTCLLVQLVGECWVRLPHMRSAQRIGVKTTVHSGRWEKWHAVACLRARLRPPS